MTDDTGPQDEPPLLAVLDTQVWIDIYLREAIIAPGNPYTAIFEAFIDGEFIPVYSRDTFDELLRMLTKSRAVAQHYKINVNDATDFVHGIFYDAGEFVKISGTLHVSSDPDDDPFVETALEARADVLVAENRDLHEPAVISVLSARGIRVMYPRQFLKMLEDRRTLKP